MTTLDRNAVTVQCLGSQAQSQRTSAPAYKFSQGLRETREKVFMSEAHVKPNMQGRCSPIGGAVYDLPSTLNKLPAVKMGTAERPRDFPGTKRDPEGDISTNDAFEVIVDSQPFKYKRQGDIKIGTDPRGKLKDAELMKAHGQAFFGRGSPGPAHIGGKFGPDYLPSKPRMAPARPFGVKLKVPDPWLVAGAPKDVGPGLYPCETSMGHQCLTKRRNQSCHAFPHGPQGGKIKSADTVSTLDNARSCLGKQSLHKNKSEPVINFNCDTRKTRDRSKICYTALDLGPVAEMPKQSFRMPPMPSERAVMGGGYG